jgi:hypothetical protein
VASRGSVGGFAPSHYWWIGTTCFVRAESTRFLCNGHCSRLLSRWDIRMLVLVVLDEVAIKRLKTRDGDFRI